MASTPQKNTSSHFDNSYSDQNTPQKVLNNVEITPSHVLREKNRHSDIFNREQSVEEKQEKESPPPKIRSNDADNDAACAKFRARGSQSNVFASDPKPVAQAQAENKSHKISNIFF